MVPALAKRGSEIDLLVNSHPHRITWGIPAVLDCKVERYAAPPVDPQHRWFKGTAAAQE